LTAGSPPGPKRWAEKGSPTPPNRTGPPDKIRFGLSQRSTPPGKVVPLAGTPWASRSPSRLRETPKPRNSARENALRDVVRPDSGPARCAGAAGGRENHREPFSRPRPTNRGYSVNKCNRISLHSPITSQTAMASSFPHAPHRLNDRRTAPAPDSPGRYGRDRPLASGTGQPRKVRANTMPSTRRYRVLHGWWGRFPGKSIDKTGAGNFVVYKSGWHPQIIHQIIHNRKLFMGLTQIMPKRRYHGKHAEESSKQV